MLLLFLKSICTVLLGLGLGGKRVWWVGELFPVLWYYEKSEAKYRVSKSHLLDGKRKEERKRKKKGKRKKIVSALGFAFLLFIFDFSSSTLRSPFITWVFIN